MGPRSRTGWSVSCSLLLVILDLRMGLAEDTVIFNRDVRPILAEMCWNCHGFDEQTRQADLRLDVPEGLFKARDGRAPVVPGNLNASELWRRVSAEDPEIVMPPPNYLKKLRADQREILKRWILQGAPYQRHWSFEPISQPTLPVVKDAQWVRNPIDRFILAELEKRGLSPKPEADRFTLARRVSFALRGLPPSWEEVMTYVNDPAEDAYERMVQRFLSAPQYGEEMARHWLDVARYADTHGLHLDNEREIWAYRDWVVQAFNRNLSFDRFTIEQLAGDLLGESGVDTLVATGFNRCNVTTSEGGSIDAEFLFRYAVERATTVAQAWLGLTAGCAVCHDHKYDPLTMREFYALYAFFYSAADPAMDGNIRNTPPFLLLPTPEQQRRQEELEQQLQSIQRRCNEAASEQPVEASIWSTEPEPVTLVLLDDLFPPGVRVTSTSRNASTWVTQVAEMPIPKGGRALHQASGASYQDRFDLGIHVAVVPQQARLQAWVHLDRWHPPEAVMIELVTNVGVRRLIWGDAERLGSGEVGSPQRFRVGELPPAAQWTHLDFELSQVNLRGGEVISQVALAQYGGKVWWDGLECTGFLPPQLNPQKNFLTWCNLLKGRDVPGLNPELASVIKRGIAAEETTSTQLDALYEFYYQRVFHPHAASPLYLLERERRQLLAERQTLMDNLAGTLVFRDLPQPRTAHVMLRGQYDKPGEPVEPGVPHVLPPLVVSEGHRPNRLDLARWLVSPQNPLTARVVVNRFWQQIFGTGLVMTSEDFGTQGEHPTHPELLDWLASWYQQSGWNTKELMKLLVCSATFRQDARASKRDLELDPQNRLYSRGVRFRLDAEQLRDQALAVSGLLNLKQGGRGVRPYQPPNIWEPVGYSDSNTRYYLQDHGSALYRRSLYLFLKRTAPHPCMSNFDAPNREQFCARRERSNTPLQALQLMNDIQHVEAARCLAERIVLEGGMTTESRLAFAIQCVLCRPAQMKELATMGDFWKEAYAHYSAHPEEAQQLIRIGERPLIVRGHGAELAAWTLTVNLLLNLDEVLCRN